MSALMFIALLAAALFLLAFLTKRRFGQLGLALGAGALISAHWTGTLTPFIEQQGIELVSPPLSSVVASVLTVLPALILASRGPKYSEFKLRIIGSSAFAILALAFLFDPLNVALLLDPDVANVITTIHQWQSTVIILGMVLAIVDIMLTRPPKDKDKK